MLHYNLQALIQSALDMPERDVISPYLT